MSALLSALFDCRLPHPDMDWKAFRAEVSRCVEAAPKVFNPLSGACLRACVRVCKCVCIRVFVYVSMRAFVNMNTCVRMCIFVYIHVRVCASVQH